MARVSLMLSGQHTPISEMVELARQAEARGFESVWVPEVWRECFVPLAAIALGTSRIKIASGIALCYARSATLLAQGAATLDEISRGRFILGLGIGAPDLNRMWHGIEHHTRPFTRLREVSEAVRLILTAHSGKVANYSGREVRLENFPLAFTPFRDRIPLYLGSLNPRSIELAGETADGLMTGALNSPRYFREIVYPHLRLGAERAGRNLDAIDVVSLVTCVVSDDVREAREMARHGIAFYLPFESIRIVFELHGFHREREAAIEALRKNDMKGLIRCVTDEMIDTLTIAGTPQECRERLEAYREFVKLPIFLPPSLELSYGQVRRNIERIIDTFGS